MLIVVERNGSVVSGGEQRSRACGWMTYGPVSWPVVRCPFGIVGGKVHPGNVGLDVGVRVGASVGAGVGVRVVGGAVGAVGACPRHEANMATKSSSATKLRRLQRRRGRAGAAESPILTPVAGCCVQSFTCAMPRHHHNLRHLVDDDDTV
jgi:hypothetical protein